MFGEDLIIKDDNDSFMKLNNFHLQSFEMNKDLSSDFIEFNFSGVSKAMSYQDDTFDYREELLKQIHKDLTE